MEDLVQPVGGLSEGARVVDTFIAPSKTFEDIRRKASWWLPFLLIVLVGIPFTYAVDKKVGFDVVADHQMHKNKFAAERIDSLPADQKAGVIAKSAVQTKYSTYGSGVFVLIFGMIVALLWWLTINFAMGAQTTYWQVFAVWMYSILPKIILYLVATALLFAGVGTENFDVQNPAGTNLGYYLPDTSPALKAAGSFIDVFGLWAMLLAVLGLSIVARKSKGQAAAVVFGWWAVGLVLTTALAAVFS